MNRRTFCRWFGALPLGSFAAEAPPNVLLVITDDQGYGDLSCHGNPVIKTPALDRLYARSIRFTNFHVSPTCAPTRAALLTGRYSNATGVWHTIMGRSLLRPGEVTMADCFRASGYRTGIFGKWHLGDNYPCRPQDRGFDVALVHGGGGVWQTPDYFGNDYFDDTYFENGKARKFAGHCTDVWFENARRFIAESAASRTPFFCYLATNAPHSPMWSPERYEAMYRGTRGLREPGFYGMIAHIDDNISRLMEFLEKRDLVSNTIVIFMTDNGTAAGAGVFNASMRGAKGSPYEGGHRVPFFLSWPAAGIGGGRDVNALTAHIDVLPTIIELCGLRRPDGSEMHGRSLKPLLSGEAERWRPRTVVVDSQRLEHLRKWRQAAVMCDAWRLVNPSPDGDASKVELYNLGNDPSQKTDVRAKFPDVVSRLRADYEAWWNQTSEGHQQPVRIVIGHTVENPVRLTAHDWHGEGATAAWNQAQIRAAPVANGVWTLHVQRTGRYRFELCRWPKETALEINSPLLNGDNREKTPGKAIQAVEAGMDLGGMRSKVSVSRTDRAAVFERRVEAGPADLKTWFREADGTERGAYYVYVTRL
jgi:arylsulfatase B